MRQLFYFLFLATILIQCKNNEGDISKKLEEKKTEPTHTHPNPNFAGAMKHKHYYGYYEMKVEKLDTSGVKYGSIMSNKSKYRFTKNNYNLKFFTIGHTVKVYKVVDTIVKDTILVQYNDNLSNNRNINNKDNFVPSIPKARGRLGCIPAFEFEDKGNDVIIINELNQITDSIIVTFYVTDHKKINKKDSTSLYLIPVKFKIDFDNFGWLNSAFKNSRKLEGGLEGNFGSLPKHADQLDLFDENGRKRIIDLKPIP